MRLRSIAMAQAMGLLAASSPALVAPPPPTASAQPCLAGQPLATLTPDRQAQPTPPAQDGDYRHLLSPTPYGWPRRDHWCVWLEPASNEGPAARWEQAWLGATEAALASWAELVPITRVAHPDQAQVRILRRRPPLRDGRASHGRAELALTLVQRGDRQVLEPQVLVHLSPGQRASAMRATALHELGHAFGLWGHSDDPADAMAAVPGAMPVLELSARDRATFTWLQRQPGLGTDRRP